MEKKIIILTGSTGGIGTKLAKKLVDDFFVIGIDKKKNNFHNKNYFHLKFDLNTLFNQPKIKNNLINKINKIIGKNKVFSLINNAALQIDKPFLKLNNKDISKVFSVNFLAPIQLLKIFLPKIIKSKGICINISSIHANLSKKNKLIYACTKAALTTLSKSIALEFGKDIISVCIEPGAFDTKMLDEQKRKSIKKIIPTKNIGDNKDIAKLVQFILKNNIKSMNGSVIDLSGGSKFNLSHD